MEAIKIVFLDVKTLSYSLDTAGLGRFGQVLLYDNVPDSEVGAAASDADVIITNQNNLNESNLKGLDKLKLICAAATGYNNIDTEYCRKRGIAVTNVPGYAAGSVAQHTFAMLFYLISHSRYYDDFVRSGTYSTIFPVFHENRDFFELQGKTWGIVGLGDIGRRVARTAQGFGCQVIYYSTSGRNHDSSFQESTLEDLLRSSDVISIHAPLNPTTKGLIRLNELRQMKRNAYLLNLGRGGIISETDLVFALENRLIAGAGLDVFEQEPLPADSPLLSYINEKLPEGSDLYMTPHIGFAGIEARERLMSAVCNNIEAFLEGRALNRVEK
jgi:glycerate dehydrogenase